MNPQKECLLGCARGRGVCLKQGVRGNCTARLPDAVKVHARTTPYSVNNETAETSEHSVVVYIDNAKETPVLLLVVVIGFGSMMLLCMGLIFIAYRWVKRNFNGANVLPGKQDTLVANGKHDTLVAKTEVNGIVMSCAPAAPVVLDAMVGYRLEGFA